MKKDTVSTAYARALLDLASERNELNVVLEEVNLLLELLREERDFRAFLMTPSIQPREKREVLDRVFYEKLTATLLDFLQVVVAKKRQLQLEDILEEYRDLYDDKMGRVHVETLTAVPMPEPLRKRIETDLSEKLQKTVLVENSVRPDILGGLVIRQGDLVVDGSIRTQLDRLAARMNAIKLGSEFVHED